MAKECANPQLKIRARHHINSTRVCIIPPVEGSGDSDDAQNDGALLLSLLFVSQEKKPMHSPQKHPVPYVAVFIIEQLRRLRVAIRKRNSEVVLALFKTIWEGWWYVQWAPIRLMSLVPNTTVSSLKPTSYVPNIMKIPVQMILNSIVWYVVDELIGDCVYPFSDGYRWNEDCFTVNNFLKLLPKTVTKINALPVEAALNQMEKTIRSKSLQLAKTFSDKFSAAQDIVQIFFFEIICNGFRIGYVEHKEYFERLARDLANAIIYATTTNADEVHTNFDEWEQAIDGITVPSKAQERDLQEILRKGRVALDYMKTQLRENGCIVNNAQAPSDGASDALVDPKILDRLTFEDSPNCKAIVKATRYKFNLLAYESMRIVNEKLEGVKLLVAYENSLRFIFPSYQYAINTFTAYWIGNPATQCTLFQIQNEPPRQLPFQVTATSKVPWNDNTELLPSSSTPADMEESNKIEKNPNLLRVVETLNTTLNFLDFSSVFALASHQFEDPLTHRSNELDFFDRFLELSLP
jgi:hypothetical protein